jgi:hypothetical protein
LLRPKEKRYGDTVIAVKVGIDIPGSSMHKAVSETKVGSSDPLNQLLLILHPAAVADISITLSVAPEVKFAQLPLKE